MRRHAMLAAERQGRIYDAVEERTVVRVAELAELLGVTPMTIRRDLDRLSSQGKLDKVHGGATSTRARVHPSTDEPGFQAKRLLQTAEKESIARAAVAMVRPGSTIGMSAGTTTWALARHLRAVAGLTVVTNSVRVADVLHEPRPDAPEVVLTGGERTVSDALVGPLALSSLRRLHLDVVLLGVHGIHPAAGLTTPNAAEAQTDQALVDAAQRLVVVADHTKWGLLSAGSIAPLSRVDVLVSDDRLADEARATLVRAGANVVLADGRPRASSA